MAIETNRSFFIQKNTTLHELGHGSYGTVYRVSSSGVVVKRTRDTRVLTASFVHEVGVLTHMKKYRSKYISEILGFDVVRKEVFLTYMETTLAAYLTSDRYRQDHIPQIISSILCGAHDLHVNGIWHYDIKPENILMAFPAAETFPTVKLSDFGLSSKKPRAGLSTQRVYTSWYRAPEIVQCIQNNQDPIYYDSMCTDMYAIGVCLFDLMAVSSRSLLSVLHGKDDSSQGFLTTKVLGHSGCRTEPVLCADCVDGTECGQSRQVLVQTLTTAFRAHNIQFDAPAFDLLAGLLYPNPHYRYMFHDVIQHPFLGLTPITTHRNTPLAPLIHHQEQLDESMLTMQSYCRLSVWIHSLCVEQQLPVRSYFVCMLLLRQMIAKGSHMLITDENLYMVGYCALVLAALLESTKLTLTRIVEISQNKIHSHTETLSLLPRCFGLVYDVLCVPTVYDDIEQLRDGVSVLVRTESLGLCWYFTPAELAPVVVWANTGVSTQRPLYYHHDSIHPSQTRASYCTVVEWLYTVCRRLRMDPRIYFSAVAILRFLFTVPTQLLTSQQLGCCALYVVSMLIGPLLFSLEQWSEASGQVWTADLERSKDALVQRVYRVLCTPTVYDVLVQRHSAAKHEVLACLYALEVIGATWFLNPEQIMMLMMTFVSIRSTTDKIRFLLNDVLLPTMGRIPGIQRVITRLRQDLMSRPL